MPGSQTTPNRADARVVASARIAFHVKDRVCVRNKNHFRGSMAGLCVPLSTLRRRPHGRLRMTRATVVRYSFSAVDSHHLLLAGFAGAPLIRFSISPR